MRAKRASVDREGFATALRARFPSLPQGEEFRIARFACATRSERVGALSSGGALVEHALELATIAHIRHRFTRYEALLDSGYDRDEARALVQPLVLARLRAWSVGASQSER